MTRHQHGRYVLDADGQPQLEPDLLAWARWLETADRRVCQDYDEGDATKRVRVSTVFLGLDYSFGEGPPLLWETMVFGGPLNGRMARYSSVDDAFAGHQRICHEVNRALANGGESDGVSADL